MGAPDISISNSFHPGSSVEPPDDPRRRVLIRALAAGVFAGSASVSHGVYAGLFGDVPKPLQPGESIYSLSGSVEVNGALASRQTIINPGNTVETGSNGRSIFVVGKDAFNLRSNSRVELEGSSNVVSALRLLTGGLLSVFGRSKQTLSTPIATISIRATGVYMEAERDRSYICTCYGVTQLKSLTDPDSSEVIRTKHHDQPRYVFADAQASKAIQTAPLKKFTTTSNSL